MSSTSPGVPGYETISVLADGSSTIVRARSLDDGGEVTVKLLDPTSEPVLPKPFDRRRRALLRLARSGQGFTPLLDHGVAADGRSYIVLPFHPIGSLQDQLDRGPTPWFPASQLMAKVAEAVGRANGEEAALGDLRPSKILLQTADTPLVTAFGMATRRFDDGRPSYRAPESDNDTPPTAPADVYSIALILAALIAGRAKERGEPIEAFLTELIGLVPARIHDVLEHGLADSVTNRYGSGAAMHRALSRAIDEGPDQSIDDGVDSAPVDLDELLPKPVPIADKPGILDRARTTADGLPADLGDLLLVGDEADGAGSGGDATADPEDHLLLPAGLDDIVLAAPSVGSGRWADADPDETTPFAFDDPIPSDEIDGSSHDRATNGHRPDDPNDADEPADSDGHAASSEDDPSRDDDHEIVDLTELFTRTQEFVFDPKIHGPADRPTDDGNRSGDGPAPPRPPGETTPSTTTTLLRPTDPTSNPDGDTAIVTGEFVADGLVTDDGPSVDATLSSVAPAPPQMPARPDAPAPADDQTDIFPETEETSPPWLATEPDEITADGGVSLLEGARSETIPFPNMGRVRNRVDDHSWQARIRTRAELVWFRGRRTFSTVLAVLGLAAIVVIVVVFAAREIRSVTTSVDTEGVPQPLTTATTGVNYLSTDAPFITDVPPSFEPTTATTARRRAASTTTAPTTSSPPVTPSTGSTAATTTPPTTIIVTTKPPTSQSSTTERTTTTDPDPSTTERTTTTRRRRRTTTVVTTRPTFQTTTTEVLPTFDDDDDDGGRGRGRSEDAAGQPDLSQPALVSLSDRSASITYSSSECVATRFRLAGTDGSVQSGTSKGYEAAIQCSSAWNLDFSGPSSLTSGVGYTLTLTVKNPAGRTASSRLEFTTPA